MEQKFIQVNITVLLYLIIFYYLKNAAISFVEFPKKMFDYVKAYYVFLIFLTILGFFKRLFMLIQIAVSHWIREMLAVLFFGNGRINASKKENVFGGKRSKRLTNWKMIQVPDFNNRQNSNTDIKNNSTNEMMKQFEQKNEKIGDNKMKCIIHENEKICSSSSEVCVLKKKKHKPYKEEIIMQIGEMRGDANLEGIEKVREAIERKKKDETDEDKKKENEDVKFDEKNNLEKNIKQVKELSLIYRLEGEKLCLRKDEVECALTNCEKNIKHMFIENKNNNVLNYFEKEIRHKSKYMESYTNSFHSNEKIYMNANVDRSSEIKGDAMKNTDNLMEESLLYKEIRKDLVDAKNADKDIRYKTEQTANEKNTSVLCDIQMKKEGNIEDDSIKNEMRPLKPILKKHSIQYSNMGKSENKENKENKNTKGVRFNNQVETYFFEKNTFEEYPFTSESRHLLWNFYESYKITSSDFFDYFNIKINFKFAIPDFLNPLNDYKNKIVKRF